MANQWFVKSGTDEDGPFTSSQLKKLVEQGRITPETSVRRGEGGKWVPLSTLTQWFVKSGTDEHGPFTSSQLKKLAEKGRITPETSVRRGEVGKWVPASRIKGLFPVPESPPVESSQQPPPAESSQQPPPAESSQQPPPVESSQQPPSVQKAETHNPANNNPANPQPTNITIEDTPDVPPDQKHRTASTRRLHLSTYLWGVIGVAALLLISLVGFFVFSGSRISLKKEELLTTEQLVAKSEASVAFIKGRRSTGTGFLIQNNVLATNRHVIDDELLRHLEVHFPSAPDEKIGPYTAQILYVDDTIDFALLTVDTPLSSLDCAEAYTFRRGQEIVVIGNPGISNDVVLQNAVSRGVMSTQTMIDGHQYNQLGVSINSGNSGGPVLDQSGIVIGVVTLKASKQEGLGFSIPIQAVNASLRKAEAMSDADVALAQSIHRARVVFKHVNTSSEGYKLCMQLYALAMEYAIDSGHSASNGLSAARKKIGSGIATIDEALVGDLKKEMSAISTDLVIPDSTRQRIVDFWTNYLELKNYVENPRGSSRSYRAKYRELSDAHDRLSETVKLLLGGSE